uniref:Secreted protein n=1 Tax=Arundo donax TaxID=35708 RepID=A0A0A9E215_ARUDO
MSACSWPTRSSLLSAWMLLGKELAFAPPSSSIRETSSEETGSTCSATAISLWAVPAFLCASTDRGLVGILAKLQWFSKFLESLWELVSIIETSSDVVSSSAFSSKGLSSSTLSFNTPLSSGLPSETFSSADTGKCIVAASWTTSEEALLL